MSESCDDWKKLFIKAHRRVGQLQRENRVLRMLNGIDDGVLTSEVDRLRRFERVVNDAIESMTDKHGPVLGDVQDEVCETVAAALYKALLQEDV